MLLLTPARWLTARFTFSFIIFARHNFAKSSTLFSSTVSNDHSLINEKSENFFKVRCSMWLVSFDRTTLSLFNGCVIDL